MKSFRRSLKGISPIFATLILIAIAVIAGVVVYMFTSGALSGMTGQGTAGQEKMAIQAVSGSSGATGTLSIYAQSVSGNAIPLDSIVVKHAGNGTVVQVITSTATVQTSLTTINVAAADLTDLAQGASYTVTLVTKAGGNFPSTSFTAT